MDLLRCSGFLIFHLSTSIFHHPSPSSSPDLYLFLMMHCDTHMPPSLQVIANLSALTHQLLGQAKTCLILLAGALFFGSPLTQQQGGGATLAMFAMAAYTKLSVDAAASEKGLGNGRGGKSNGSYSHSEDGWQRNSHYGSSSYSGHQHSSNAGRRRSPTGRARQRRTTSAPHEDELAFII